MPVRPLSDLDKSIVHRYYNPRGANPVPAAQSTEAPTYCLRINAHWVGHVLGLLMALDQQDAWAGSSGEIEFARNEARKLVASLNICGDDEPQMDCLPIGSIIIWSTDTIPDGWLLCNGDAVNAEDFPELAAMYPFNLPNFSGRVPMGTYTYNPDPEQVPENTIDQDIELGDVIGSQYHQLTIDEMAQHDHWLSFDTGARYTNVAPGGSADIGRNANNFSSLHRTTLVGGNMPHNNMQPSRGVFFIIKAKNCEPETITAMSYKLRQKPTDKCVLEQSLDGGTTWMTAFDYNQCFGEMKQDVKDIKEILENLNTADVIEYIDNITNIYQGDVTNVYPDAEYGDADDIHRDQALCFALEMYALYLKELMKGLIKDLQPDDNSAGLAAIGFGAASSVIGAVAGFGIAIPFAPYVVGGFAIASALAAIYQAVSDARDVDVSDEDIDEFDMSDWICCVYNEMAGLTISEPLFQNSFTVCAGSSFGTEELDHLMREMLLIIAQDKAVFIGFLKMLSISFQASKDGVDLPCMCADSICEAQDFEATNAAGAFTIRSGSTLVAGQGVRGASNYTAAAIQIDLGTVVDVTEVRAEWYSPRNDDGNRFYIAISDDNITYTFLFDEGHHPIGRQIEIWQGSASGRYVRITGDGSIVNARRGQIFKASVCYE